MWPFRRQKAWHQLADDLPTTIDELMARKHWERVPKSLVQDFGANAQYVFDRPGEAARALKCFVGVLESRLFRGILQHIGSPADQRYDLSILCLDLGQLAAQSAETMYSAETPSDQKGALDTAYGAATSIVVSERYALSAYITLAQLNLAADRKAEAVLWCDRYHRAEYDLLAEDESILSTVAQVARIQCDPERYSPVVEELRTVLPGFEPANSREELERIESLIVEEMCHAQV